MSANEFLPWVRRAAAPVHGRDAAPVAATDETPIPRMTCSAATSCSCSGSAAWSSPSDPAACAGSTLPSRCRRTAAEPWSPVVYVRSSDGRHRHDHLPPLGDGPGHPHHDADDHRRRDGSRLGQVPRGAGDGDEKKYGSQNTDGSTSIRDFLPKYREAGATMRALLEDAAAKAVGRRRERSAAPGSTRSCTARPGARRRSARWSRRRARIAMPAKERVRIKRPDERRWQGKKMPSIDLVPMTTGTARLRRRRRRCPA